MAPGGTITQVVLRRSSDLAAQLAGARHRIAELERELAERATYDELSGLLSAQRLHARLESEVQRTQRHHRPLTVGLIDADGFRGFNASTGAPRGPVAGDAGDALGPESEAQRDAVSALAVALLERDQYTGEHSESVVEMATSVARGLGSDQREVDAVAPPRSCTTSARWRSPTTSSTPRARALGRARLSRRGQR